MTLSYTDIYCYGFLTGWFAMGLVWLWVRNRSDW